MGQHVLHLMWMAWIPLMLACDTRSTPADVVWSDDRDTVKVMTYNIFHDGASSRRGIAEWPDRRDAVVRVIRSEAPDVVGLQEAEVWQVEWLLEEMPEYAAVARGPYADPGIHDAETVAVLYLQERFELRESGHFWYSDSPESPGSYGSDDFGGMMLPRMATWVRLTSRNTSDAMGFYVFNTHFIANSQAADPQLARRKSAEVLVRRIVERAFPEAPVFAIGDFNAAPDESPVRYLLGSLCESGGDCPATAPLPGVPMVDAWSSLHPEDMDTGTRCSAATSDDGPRVDHIFVWIPGAESCDSGSGSCSAPEILSAEIVDRGPSCPSDHKPVVATIALPVPG